MTRRASLILPDSTVITLPAGLRLKDNSISHRLSKQNRVLADGAFSEGEEVEDRSVTLDGHVDADSRQELLDLLNVLRQQAQIPGSKLRINAGHYINLTRLKEFEDEAEAGYDRTLSRVRITWQCDDPYWHADSLRSVEFSPSGNTTFSVDAATGQQATWRGQHPVITVTAPANAAVGSFVLRNDSDQGLQLRYADPLLKNGAVAILDCVKGKASRGGQSTVRFVQGEWLRLVNAVNSIAYEGPACTVKIEWRPRWL